MDAAIRVAKCTYEIGLNMFGRLLTHSGATLRYADSKHIDKSAQLIPSSATARPLVQYHHLALLVVASEEHLVAALAVRSAVVLLAIVQRFVTSMGAICVSEASANLVSLNLDAEAPTTSRETARFAPPAVPLQKSEY